MSLDNADFADYCKNKHYSNVLLKSLHLKGLFDLNFPEEVPTVACNSMSIFNTIQPFKKNAPLLRIFSIFSYPREKPPNFDTFPKIYWATRELAGKYWAWHFLVKDMWWFKRPTICMLTDMLLWYFVSLTWSFFVNFCSFCFVLFVNVGIYNDVTLSSRDVVIGPNVESNIFQVNKKEKNAFV